MSTTFSHIFCFFHGINREHSGKTTIARIKEVPIMDNNTNKNCKNTKDGKNGKNAKDTQDTKDIKDCR